MTEEQDKFKEDYDHRKLVSEKITWNGFIVAMVDVVFMGIYLMGGLGFLAASGYPDQPRAIVFAFLAAAVFLVVRGMFVEFSRLAAPIYHYQTIRTFKLPDGTTLTEIDG